MSQPKILVVEDDPVIGEFLKTGLGYENYSVTVIDRGMDALEILKEIEFDLLILDIMLPDIDGFEVCKRLRSRGNTIPILMLTVKGDICDRVKGLDSGADDYLVKPFSFEELLARIRALLRRLRGIEEDNILTCGKIIMDVEARKVKIGGEKIELTPTEFRILELFLRYPCRVFTRETLLNRALGYDFEGETNVIDVHISHLRQKLKDRPPRLIRTIYGVGYSFYPEGNGE